MRNSLTILAALIAVTLTSCQPYYMNPPFYSYSNEPISLGLVQRKLQRGMSPDQVAYALGSPNIVTKDKCGHETWIYDLQSTDFEISQTHSDIWLLIGTRGSECVTGSSSQKSLTVIVKFDEYNSLDRVSYRSSKF